jgi:hypothetical protein
MSTVVFVHGTGVRREQYLRTFSVIEKRIQAARPDVTVTPCLWGDALGARLQADGRSIPIYETTLALGGELPADDEVVRWERLYDDPLFELKLLTLLPPDPTVNPWTTGHGSAISDALATVRRAAEVQDALVTAGLAEVFDEAVSSVLKSDMFQDAVRRIGDLSEGLRDPVARAVVAEAIALCRQSGIDPLASTDPVVRDAAVRAVAAELGEDELGLGGWLTRQVFRFVAPLATSRVRDRRGAITLVTYPVPGDILVYQAAGRRIREFIAGVVEAATPPVVLLSHSLGGIACVDLLVERPLPQVELLVTVGCQAPFLYEIGALSSLEFGHPLPSHFPSWLNIYDLRDFLSYVGAGVFPDRVQDILVDSRLPFPQAHSGYWTNPTTWSAILPRVPASG